MLTTEQQEEFRRFGILRVPGAVPSADAEAMCDFIWQMLLQRYQIHRDDPETWGARRLSGYHDLPKSMTFAQVASPVVCELLDDLLGPANWQSPGRWGSLLAAFPESRERWRLAYQNWHLDAPVVRSLTGLFGVRVFTCLAKLPPGGGGTLAVAGSYRLAENLALTGGFDKLRSTEVRKVLVSRHRWLKSLETPDKKSDRIRDFMDTTTELGGVDVRVVEMTGEPGDVILMHPLTMHAPSPNCAAVPRIVLSTTVYKCGVDASIQYGSMDEAANR